MRSKSLLVLLCVAALLSSTAVAQRRPGAGNRVARASVAAPVTVTLVRWPYT